MQDMRDVSRTGNSTNTHGDGEVVEEQTPTTAQRQFPPTLVGLDPPTLPASDGLGKPSTGHRDVERSADLPQFRSFPEPQRSVPGHPTLRRTLRRVFLFWRRSS